MGGSGLVERLNQLFSYDPNTGEFTRKISVQGFRCEAGMVAGSIDKHGYININVDGVKYKAHRLAWLMMHGVWPNGEIDHDNRVRSDNRIKNLKDVTSEQNKWNTKLHNHNTSGEKGVSWDNQRKQWRASITVRNKFKHLGFFDDVTKAKEARSVAESEFRGNNWGLAG